MILLIVVRIPRVNFNWYQGALPVLIDWIVRLLERRNRTSRKCEFISFSVGVMQCNKIIKFSQYFFRLRVILKLKSNARFLRIIIPSSPFSPTKCMNSLWRILAIRQSFIFRFVVQHFLRYASHMQLSLSISQLVKSNRIPWFSNPPLLGGVESRNRVEAHP